jgi:hypothetical protein
VIRIRKISVIALSNNIFLSTLLNALAVGALLVGIMLPGAPSVSRQAPRFAPRGGHGW